ncbi:MAG TPA: phenylalanine--tRNA ligase subunit alpha [Candidatus Elarobacter sp.]|nr:phenylalanine--tRNA ligase subunit alpha [Candidatus Elarobacter sp.]HEV2738938.1 phenylalanine--tRNA ligase subunit alpha [Candidatus Elarobacter sp.]
MTTTGMNSLEENLASLTARFDEAVANAPDAHALDEVRVAFLGRSGEVTTVRRGIGALPPAERPNAGKVINAAVEALEAKLAEALARVERAGLERSLEDAIDVTFPGPRANIGAIHPVRRVGMEVARFFTRHGFAVVLGPEIETDANNFDALNIPPDHPAREGLDSFYLRPDLVLRTHTSPMQVRSMRKHGPPIAIIVPGKAYRRDAVDARHLYMFYQVEGLMVGHGIHFGHLKGMLVGMCRELFGPSADVRFRPSFFPFTEPSAEIDVKCPACEGRGGVCRTCGGSGWIEIGGSGMVHPNVLRSVGYDPDAVTGWAFGCGLERIAMKRHDINDIRAFVENMPGFAEALA